MSLPTPDDAPATAMDEPVYTCPACGEPADYCQGHGEIGDPLGRAILDAHDDDVHEHCHWRSDCVRQ